MIKALIKMFIFIKIITVVSFYLNTLKMKRRMKYISPLKNNINNNSIDLEARGFNISAIREYIKMKLNESDTNNRTIKNQ